MHQQDQKLQLWHQMLQGNLEALEQIYTHYHSDLYRYALKITSQPELAEDALQDVFVDIWTYRKQLGSIHSLHAYLMRAVRNQCLKLLKKQQRFVGLETVEQFDAILPEELQLKDASERVKKIIATSMTQLSPRQREILYLKFYNNLDYEELAEILDINYQSVINHIHKAMIKLRAMDVLKHIDY